MHIIAGKIIKFFDIEKKTLELTLRRRYSSQTSNKTPKTVVKSEMRKNCKTSLEK